MRRSFDIYEGTDLLAPYMSHTYMIKKSHVTHMKESCCTYEDSDKDS